MIPGLGGWWIAPDGVRLMWHRMTWASEQEQKERVEWHLQNWARAHRSYTGHRPRKGGRSFASDLESMANQADLRCALAMDAIIEALEPRQEHALHVEYLGLKNRLEGLAEALEAARGAVAKGLNAKGVW